MSLNESAKRLCDQAVARAAEWNIGVATLENGGRLLDFGLAARGGLAAGACLAEICLAGKGSVALAAPNHDLWPGPTVLVQTDQPLAACMASQYAGWQISLDDYFAMGSGPMRAARGREKLFDAIGGLETAPHVVGVLETAKPPTAAVFEYIGKETKASAAGVTLCIAPTSSLAGSLQIVARSIETSLHKMHELGFDITCVESGFGTAPLPPVAADDMQAIGRTNDAVLYGGEVTLWLRAEDDALSDLVKKIPSSASRDFGQPFADIFKHYAYDFYKIDPLLFSPAVVNLMNLATGRTHRFGELQPAVLEKSFLG